MTSPDGESPQQKATYFTFASAFAAVTGAAATGAAGWLAGWLVAGWLVAGCVSGASDLGSKSGMYVPRTQRAPPA